MHAIVLRQPTQYIALPFMRAACQARHHAIVRLSRLSSPTPCPGRLDIRVAKPIFILRQSGSKRGLHRLQATIIRWVRAHTAGARSAEGGAEARECLGDFPIGSSVVLEPHLRQALHLGETLLPQVSRVAVIPPAAQRGGQEASGQGGCRNMTPTGRGAANVQYHDRALDVVPAGPPALPTTHHCLHKETKSRANR